MTGSPALRIDARGLRCPLPVLRARKALAELVPGALLELLADDPMAEIDLPHFCAEAGHVLVQTQTAAPKGGGMVYLIRKAG